MQTLLHQMRLRYWPPCCGYTENQSIVQSERGVKNDASGTGVDLSEVMKKEFYCRPIVIFQLNRPTEYTDRAPYAY